MLAELSIDLKPQRKKVIKQDHDHAIDQEKKSKLVPPVKKQGPHLENRVQL